MPNVIQFPGKSASRPHCTPVATQREEIVAIIEDHVLRLEPSNPSVQRIRALIGELKALEGYTWQFPASLS